MAISREDVSHIAVLAGLSLTKQEADLFLHQLNDILHYVEILNRPGAEDVQPMRHIYGESNVLREDVRKESLEREAALRNAPSRKGEYVTVPKMILPVEEQGKE